MCVGGRLFIGLILLASFGASPCLSLESSGEAVAVVQATSATGPGGKRVLAETQPVYSGDTISTGGAGLAQIQFRDETRLVVGPNSNVVIDRFVLASDSSASGASIRFAKGTFRFITGSGASLFPGFRRPNLSLSGNSFRHGSGRMRRRAARSRSHCLLSAQETG